MRTLLSFEEAREIVLTAAPRRHTEHVPLAESRGRTLAADIVSADTIPPFDNSAMDGYAVLSSDCTEVPVRLRIVAEIPAGKPFSGSIRAGECARIMTGAPVPTGVDAVVPVERTKEMDGDTVSIEITPREGDHIRLAGADIQNGERVLESGVIITPPVVGMMATLGVTSIPVAIAPRVAVISTGDEIVSPEQNPGPGQIRNSNGPAIAAQVEAAGGRVVVQQHAPDDPGSLTEMVEAAGRVDLILFSGGVSMGKYDYVRTELQAMGAEWQFWKVRQRPGKPLIFGILNDTLLLGLPGNPVSSAVCFEVYARPLIARQLGRKDIIRPLHPARLERDLKKVKGLRYFARGIVREAADGLTVSDTGPQGSNLYSSMVKANCLIHLDEELENPEAGATVLVERLDW